MATIRSSIELQDNFTSVLYQVIDSVNMGMAAMEDMSRTMNAPVDVSAMRDSLAQASAALTQYGAAARGEISEGTQAQREMNEELERGAGRAHSMMDAVKGMVGAYATIRTVASAINASDELTQTIARLNMMNDGLQSTDDLLNMVYTSAQNARGSFTEMSGVVARFGNNAKDAFGSSAEVVAFSELVQKQMTIAGASTAEASAAMLQLSQALGSGVLRGDELNSIFEQAPNLIQNIADYLNVPIGQIREMASEGQLSADVVKSAIFAASDEINANFESMPMTWGQVWQSMQNTALVAFRPVLKQINDIANSEEFQSFSNGLIQALSVVAAVATEVFGMMVGLGAAIADNWSWISPIIYGVAAALTAYCIALGIYNTIQAISNGIKAAAAFAEKVHAASLAMESGATFAATAAQHGFNAALLSCPITWIIILIVALIALFYAVIGLINKIAGTSISATGVICGAIATACSLVLNVVIGVINAILQCLWSTLAEPFISIIEWILNVATGGFDSFGDAVANLVGNIISWFLSLGKVVTKIIDAIFDTDWTAGLSSLQDSVLEWGKNENSIITLDRTAPAINHRFEYGEAWDAGYNFGAGIEESVKKFDPSNLFNTEVPGADDYASGIQGIGDGVGDISGNTKDIADSLEITKEELKYLRDIAEREVVNRITAANINVDMTNNNTVSKDSDLDSIVERLRSRVEEEMNAAAEGVH